MKIARISIVTLSSIVNPGGGGGLRSVGAGGPELPGPAKRSKIPKRKMNMK